MSLHLKMLFLFAAIALAADPVSAASKKPTPRNCVTECSIDCHRQSLRCRFSRITPAGLCPWREGNCVDRCHRVCR